MRKLLVLCCLLLSSGVALAAPPPPKPVPAPPPTALDKLFDQLAKADSADDAHPIESRIENIFRQSGSASVDLLMTRVVACSGANDSKTARQLVEAVNKIAPGYAEAWYVRAELENAAGDDTSALVSLQKVVTLNPRQFKALEELGGMLEEYGDKKSALDLYRRAAALDPQLEGAARKIRELTHDVEGQDI